MRATMTLAFLPAALLALFGFSAPGAGAQNAVCPSPDGNRIVFMGSSVCLGYAASNAGGPFDYYQSFLHNHKGYAFNYATLLDQRGKQGLGARWKVMNISVSGNSTPSVLSRWAKDLLPQCGRYVIYGLSLANEGIVANPAAFDQFRTNMQKLIAQARDSGMVPVVVGTYGNNDFSAETYGRIKAMNLLIHRWDVPSVNVLGALDDGAGHWTPGHFSDAGHPNDKGYRELASAFVPSLFDALAAGKPRPAKQTTAGLRFRRGDALSFQPEGGLRSFTVAFELRTAARGTVLEWVDGAHTGSLAIDSTGVPAIRSARRGTVAKGQARLDDGAWHAVALTFYAARSKRYLYVDGGLQILSPDDTVAPGTFRLGGAQGPDSVQIRNLLFYRSGMTPEEVQAMRSGDLLQSSLEIYAPLDGQGKSLAAAIVNEAQSRNTLTADFPSTGLRSPGSARSRPPHDRLRLGAGPVLLPAEGRPEGFRVFGLTGRFLGTLPAREHRSAP